MDQVTVKSSTIVVAVGERTEVYRSVRELPPALRKKLVASTRGANSGTILIADRAGREELARAIQGLPSQLQSRMAPTSPRGAADVQKSPRWFASGRLLRSVFDLVWPGAVGLAVWLLFTSR